MTSAYSTSSGEPTSIRFEKIAFVLAFVLVANVVHATPLHDAAQTGDAIQAGALIMDDPSAVNVRDKRGFTPLSVAAQQGHVAVVKLLLEKGAAIDAKVNYAGAPPRVAAFYADPAIVKRLTIKAPIEAIGATPLYVAAAQGHSAVVELLLERGAGIDAKAEDAGPPLAAAAAAGHADVVKLLLERGAAIDGTDERGSTPLYGAAARGQLESARLLLEKGAAIEGLRDDGTTPLTAAALKGHAEMVRLLLAKGANVNAKDKEGRTPLAGAEHANAVDAATRTAIVEILKKKQSAP